MSSIPCRAFSLFWWLSAEMKQAPGLEFKDSLGRPFGLAAVFTINGGTALISI
jgi:hypothetical protein